MALQHFYGELLAKGRRTTRPGTMSSGLVAKAHSKQGTVVVELSESNGIDHARIYLTPHPTTRKGSERMLYDGPIGGTETPDVVIKFPSRAVREVTMPDPELLCPLSAEEIRQVPGILPPRRNVRDVARVLTGPIFPPRIRTIPPDAVQGYDCNEGYDPEPRRSLGKLALRPDASD